ncbi:MAG: DUF892 family protein [Dactylosporangium sp.]|nr:DUF892 family protein [Dactylosporangium sp.]
MALDSPRELFLFELGQLRETEQAGGSLLGEFAAQVRDDALKEALGAQEQEGRKLAQNVNACLRSLGGAPLETTSHVVEAVRNSFQEFLGYGPSPELFDLMMIRVSSWYAEHTLVRYRGLLDYATFLGEYDCGRLLLANLVAKETFIAQLRQISVSSALKRVTASALALTP